MEKQFEFADEQIWSDEKLQERAAHLGRHILMIPEGSTRHYQISREINHLIFELSIRTIAEAATVGVQ